MIKLENLTKNFGKIKAVKGISFEVREGEIFGLLGPNGAGKTTTVGMLTSEVKPTSGRAFVNGIDVEKRPLAVKRQIGVIPQHRSLDRHLTGRENIKVMADAYGVKNPERRVEEVLSLLGIRERLDDPITSYSGGMLQQLLIARSLVHHPKIIFLDEPTLGLDPYVRRIIWKKIEKLNKEGRTFLLTTHYMEEADALCDRVAIMNKGEIIKIGKPQELKEKDSTKSVIILELTQVPQEVVDEVKEFKEVKDVKVTSGKRLMEMCIYAKNGREISPKIMDSLRKRKLKIHSLDMREPTLEDVFINLTGEKLER